MARSRFDPEAIRAHFADSDPDVVKQALDAHDAIAAELFEHCQSLRKDCFPASIETMPEHDQILYLALRRGMLLIQAQRKWLKEVDGYLENGSLKR